jgi:hypothetical protein
MEGHGGDLDVVLTAYDVAAGAGVATARFWFDTGLTAETWESIEAHMPAWMRTAVGTAANHVRESMPDFDPSRIEEIGIVDLAGPSSAMRRLHMQTRVIVGDREWWGAPGDELDANESERVDDMSHPLWLLGLLKGAVSATQIDPVDFDEHRYRGYEVLADLRVASAAAPGGLAPCEVARVEDLAALPITVVVDDAGRVCRVAGGSTFGESGNTHYVVELRNFGERAPIDWTHIPAITTNVG